MTGAGVETWDPLGLGPPRLRAIFIAALLFETCHYAIGITPLAAASRCLEGTVESLELACIHKLITASMVSEQCLFRAMALDRWSLVRADLMQCLTLPPAASES